MARASGLNQALCPAAGCEPGDVLRTLAVPAGSYLITASAELTPTPFVANESRNMECHVERADTGDFQRALHLYRAGPTSAVDEETIQVTWAQTLPAATTLELSCTAGNTAFQAANARITALRVGSLVEAVS